MLLWSHILFCANVLHLWNTLQRITAERHQGSSLSDCTESGNLVCLEIKVSIDKALIAEAFAHPRCPELSAAGSPWSFCCIEREPGSLAAPLLPELPQPCQPLEQASAGTLVVQEWCLEVIALCWLPCDLTRHCSDPCLLVVNQRSWPLVGVAVCDLNARFFFPSELFFVINSAFLGMFLL